ncbi:MAG: substrate-binding domain-containing protein [Gemmataceae bacterium]
MPPRFAWAIVPLAVAFGLCAGCGRSNKEGDKKDGDKARYAFLSNNIHGFWTYAQRGAEKAGKELGVEVDFERPDPDTLTRQQQIIEDLLLRGINGFAVSPNDPSNMVAFLKTNPKIAKIPVIAADNDLPDPTARKCYIGTHNYRAGRAAGELVKKALPKGGRIAIFVGHMVATNAKERRQGVLDVLAGIERTEMGEMTPADAKDEAFGPYVLVETRTDGGKETACQEKAEDLLRSGVKIDCLVGLWEYNPPALLRAVDTVVKSGAKPAIVAFDENFQTMEAIQADRIIGSVAQDPFKFGYLSIKALDTLHKGQDLKKMIEGEKLTLDAENRCYVPHTVVTKANVNAFYERLKELRK